MIHEIQIREDLPSVPDATTITRGTYFTGRIVIGPDCFTGPFLRATMSIVHLHTGKEWALAQVTIRDYQPLPYNFTLLFMRRDGKEGSDS